MKFTGKIHMQENNLGKFVFDPAYIIWTIISIILNPILISQIISRSFADDNLLYLYLGFMGLGIVGIAKIAPKISLMSSFWRIMMLFGSAFLSWWTGFEILTGMESDANSPMILMCITYLSYYLALFSPSADLKMQSRENKEIKTRFWDMKYVFPIILLMIAFVVIIFDSISIVFFLSGLIISIIAFQQSNHPNQQHLQEIKPLKPRESNIISLKWSSSTLGFGTSLILAPYTFRFFYSWGWVILGCIIGIYWEKRQNSKGFMFLSQIVLYCLQIIQILLAITNISVIYRDWFTFSIGIPIGYFFFLSCRHLISSEKSFSFRTFIMNAVILASLMLGFFNQNRRLVFERIEGDISFVLYGYVGFLLLSIIITLFVSKKWNHLKPAIEKANQPQKTIKSPEITPKINLMGKDAKNKIEKRKTLVFGLFIVILVSNFVGLLQIINPTTKNSQLIYYDESGNLQYTYYANTGEFNAVNRIPDYSFAGYMGGGVSLPEAPVLETLIPSNDDQHQIQSAINNISQQPLINGIRGALLLKKGEYRINGSIYINASGIVIRGEGQGQDGTILIATAAVQHDFLFIQGKGKDAGIPEIQNSQRQITTSYLPTGATSIQVNNTESYASGDRIVVVRTPNQNWIDDLEMAPLNWTPEIYVIKHERTITKVNTTHIEIDIPIVDSIQDKYGGGYVAKSNISGRISQCGIEMLRIVSTYAHLEDEDHGWKAITLSRTINSWVQKVTCQYFGYSCVAVDSESNFNTIQDCAYLDGISLYQGSRRYSFIMIDGIGNLFQRCYTRDGRHDFVTQSRVTGPNVFLDCLSVDPHSDIGPHHRWATGNLYDNVQGGELRARNRATDSDSGHGWTAAQNMFWNCNSPTHYIMVESPPGAMNYAIACSGRKYDGEGYWELWNQKITPRSLYLAQLEDRLGSIAIQNIVVSEQLEGDIYSILNRWAGEGDLYQFFH